MHDFRKLSPLDFEELVRDLLQAEYGVRFESFGSGPDTGIDFRFATQAQSWKERAAGSAAAIVQVKHHPDMRTDALARVAGKENGKVAKLKPSRYIFVTSASLTPPAKDKISAALPDAPLAVEDILGQADLNNLLTRHAEVERKHFKLWLTSTAVLERILHSGVYNRTEAEMDEIKAIVPKFVQNNSVPDAETILAKHGTLIIAGEPGIGKSTLARMLVWLHAEQDWRISVIDDISEAFEIADGHEKRLVFFDDFLGQVGLTRDLIRGVDARFPPFFRRVRSNPNLRFILTTRDYILRQAQAQSGRLDTAEVNAAEFVLNVSHYSRASRAQILYNHIYFSGLSELERGSILSDDFFLKIIDHRNFNPRLIDLLTSADYVSMAGRPIRETVTAVLENPEELWEKPYRTHISEDGRALMVALFFNSPRVQITDLERSFGRAAKALGLAVASADVPPKFRAAVRELEGSVLSIQDRAASFSNPGVRDFLHKAIRQDKQLKAIVGVVTDLAELKTAWDYYWSYSPQAGGTAIAAWVAAAKRMVDYGAPGALDQLAFVVDMYDQFRADTLLPIIKDATATLEQSELDNDDVDLCKEMLEKLCATLLPADVQEATQDIVSKVTAEMISAWGGTLPLEDLESLADHLNEYGTDQGAAADAVRVAIATIVDDLYSTLSDIQSVDDLEQFERQLTKMMDDYGVSSLHATTRIETRKDELLEGYGGDDEEGYGGRSRPSSAAGISDDQIRSMFSSLQTAGD